MRVALPFLALAFVGALATPAKDQKDADWESFKVEYNKRYSSVTEEALRKKIFLKNQEEILRHNEDFEKGLTTFTMKINQFSDLLPSEIEESRPPMMARKDNDWFAQLGIVELFQSPTSDDDDVPDSIDWRLEGAVTPPKNQHTCGACWAFSATGGLEGQLYLKTGKLESLSEQNLIDCAKEANGCKGGSLPHAYQYVKKHGIRTEASYPYRNKRGECRENDTIAEVRIKQFLHVSAGDENDLKAAVGTAGPVPVCIDARPSFNNYHRGVYHEKHCNKTVTNHCVLVVGYGTTEVGQDYWIVKNSWGPNQWGEGGYIRMARNMNNMCAIATFGYLPLISDD